MRIVFFSHYFPPEGNAPASRTYDHCVRWARSGHDVTVITCAPNVPNGIVYEGYKNRLWPQRETVDGVNVVRVWTFVAANAGGMKRILNYVSYLISALFAFVFFVKRPQLIISTSPQLFCGWTGIFASWFKWTKLILEIRDIWPESIVTVGAMKKGLLFKLLEIMERWMYYLPNHVVAVGNGYKDNIVNKVDVSKRISVVTNGVDPNVFQPEPKSDRFLAQYGLQDRFVCSYVGTIGMAHGLDVILRCAKRLKDEGCRTIGFCLVGDGAQRDQLEKSTQEQGLEEWVKFTGRLPKSQMSEVLCSSDCLLIHLKKTDLFETVIPSKIFEAMAVERPLIMAVRGESAEIVRRSKAGIEIEPENEDELLQAIKKLSENSEYYDSLCQHGREFVLEHYTRDVLANSFLEIMEDVAAGRKVRPNAN